MSAVYRRRPRIIESVESAWLQRLVFFDIYWSTFLCEVSGVDDEILTIRENGALLKIGKKTAYTMAQRGALLGFKMRDQ